MELSRRRRGPARMAGGWIAARPRCVPGRVLPAALVVEASAATADPGRRRPTRDDRRGRADDTGGAQRRRRRGHRRRAAEGPRARRCDPHAGRRRVARGRCSPEPSPPHALCVDPPSRSVRSRDVLFADRAAVARPRCGASRTEPRWLGSARPGAHRMSVPADAQSASGGRIPGPLGHGNEDDGLSGFEPAARRAPDGAAHAGVAARAGARLRVTRLREQRRHARPGRSARHGGVRPRRCVWIASSYTLRC